MLVINRVIPGVYLIWAIRTAVLLDHPADIKEGNGTVIITARECTDAIMLAEQIHILQDNSKNGSSLNKM